MLKNSKLGIVGQAYELHHIAGDNVALIVGVNSAVIITTEYPISNKSEVRGLLECAEYGQAVPSTSFCAYQKQERELAREAYQCMLALPN